MRKYIHNIILAILGKIPEQQVAHHKQMPTSPDYQESDALRKSQEKLIEMLRESINEKNKNIDFLNQQYEQQTRLLQQTRQTLAEAAQFKQRYDAINIHIKDLAAAMAERSEEKVKTAIGFVQDESPLLEIAALHLELLQNNRAGRYVD